MESLEKYEIAYPKIAHPLIYGKSTLKEKYVQLLFRYVDAFADKQEKAQSMYRLDALSHLLLNKSIADISSLDEKKYKASFTSVNKTRFIPFYLFSYRYLFLYDALFIMGIDNQKIGELVFVEILNLTNKRFHQSLREMIEKMYCNDTAFAQKRIISPEMVDAWINARMYLASKEKKITFTATMSAGKSTLINAIIGRELSFSKKAACTSTVMRFRTTPCKTSLFCVSDNSGKVKFMSEQETRSFTNALTNPCEILGNFDSLLTFQRLSLVDTPGVNSSQNPIHRKITREELKNGTDVLVYVIPVENYGSEDDYNHLKYIRKYIPYKGILFVVNMMDTCDFEDDSTEEIIDNIRSHLSVIGFDNPVVCPMSAKAGILLKKAISGVSLSHNDKEECDKYVKIFRDKNLQLGDYYPAIKPTKENHAENSLWQTFISTGLPGFEYLLYQYVNREEQ